MNEKKSSGILNKLIDKLPIELHIPTYQYCGPGTKLSKILARGDQGKDKLDLACKNHDISYKFTMIWKIDVLQIKYYIKKRLSE